MGEKLTLRMESQEQRHAALDFITTCPLGVWVRVSKPTRSEEQSERFYSMCLALAKSAVVWPPNAGKRRTKDEWKSLLVSGVLVATGRKGELTYGLEFERVNLRPSTTTLTVAEMSDLIEYTRAFCAERGVELKD